MGKGHQQGAEDCGAGHGGHATLDHTRTPQKMQRAAQGEARNDSQGAPEDCRLSQGKAGQALENEVKAEQQSEGRGDGDLRPVPQLERHEGEGREGEIGEPFRGDGPGRMVPAGHRGEPPGMHQQQIGDQRGQGQDIGIDDLADGQGGGAEGPDPQQTGQVQGVDPRQPRPQEAPVAEAALFHALQIDVAEDEARKREEDFDAEVTFGHDGGGEIHRKPGPIGEEHHPHGGEESERGERLQVLRLHRNRSFRPKSAPARGDQACRSKSRAGRAAPRRFPWRLICRTPARTRFAGAKGRAPHA